MNIQVHLLNAWTLIKALAKSATSVPALLVAGLMLALNPGTVQATTYTFTRTTAATYAWTDTGSWDANGVPVSANDAGVTFFSDITTALGQPTFTINTDPATLTLNTLTLNGKGASATANTAVNIGTAGNTWTFDGTTPTINLAGVNGTKTLSLTILPNLILNQNLAVSGNGTAGFTFSGTITESGSRSLTKSGSGILTLNGVNTYTGDTTISGGTLIIGGSLGNGNYAGNISIANNGVLNFANTVGQTLSGNITNNGALTITGYGTYVVSGNISGSGSVTYANTGVGSGALTLSGTNTYTGTSSFGENQRDSSLTVTVSSFDYITSGSYANHGLGSSLGAPTTAANGTILIGVNGNGNRSNPTTLKYTGPGETTDRILTFSFSQTSSPRVLDASGTGLLKFTSPFTLNYQYTTGGPWFPVLTLQGSGLGEVAAGITDLYTGLPVTKSGTGIWTLSGANTYTGATAINSGILIGVAGGGCANSAVTVANTASCTLGVRVDDNTKQWTCASLTSAGTLSTLAFGFNTAPSTTLAPLKVTGNLTFTGTPVVTIDPANLTAVTYPLLVYGGTLSGTAPTTATIGRGLSGTLAWGTGSPYSTATLVLTVTGASTLPLTWATSTSGTWDINTTANWKDSATPTPASVKYLDGADTGDTVVFDDTYVNADTTVTLNTNVKPASVTANNATYNYTITGNGAIIGGTGLTKSGIKTLTLSTANFYTGATAINGGALIGVAGGGCANSAVTVANTTGCTLGVRVDDNTKQWTCASLTSAGTLSTLAFGFNTAPSTTRAPLKVNGTLTFTGIPAITVDPANLVSGQSYPLITCGGTAPGGTPTVTIGRGLTGTTSWNGNTLMLAVLGTSTLPLKWATSTSGTWDINTTANWMDSATPTPASVNYLDGADTGDAVVFDDTYVNADTTVTLNTVVKPASVTANNSTHNYTITGNGAISGLTGLTKSGAGTLTLSTPNTYSGTTVINGGVVNAGVAQSGTTSGPLGANGAITFGGGTLQFSAASAAWDPSARIAAGTSSGAVSLDPNGQNVTFGTALTASQSGGLTVNDTAATKGSLTLSGANNHAGGTTLTAGTLNIQNATALGTGVLTINGGSLDTKAAGITMSANNAQNWNADFTFAGAGNLSLGAGAVTMNNSRQVTVSANTLTVGGTISGSGYNITKAGSGTLTLSGNVTTGAGAITINSSSGVLTLAGANTFSGGMTLNSSSTLNINSVGALGQGSFTIAGGTINNTSGADITSSTYNPTINWNADFTFTGTGNLNLGSGAVTMNNSRQVTVSANTLTVGGTISGSTYSLTKAGTGTLTLSGNNGYTGGTTLSAGSLLIGNANALGTSGTITFNGGTLASSSTTGYTLGNAASLSFTGDATFGQTSGGTGTLTLSGNGTLTAIGHTLTVNNNTTLSGAIGGAGSLTKAGNGTLTLSGPNIYSGSTTVSSGQLMVIGSYTGAAAGSQFFVNGGSMTFSMNAGSATFYGDGYNSSPQIGVGAATTGLLTLNSGTLGVLSQTGAGTSYGSLRLGTDNAAAKGTIIVNGGTLNVDGRILMAANKATAAGTLTIAGGQVNLGTTGNYSNGVADPGNGLLWFGAGVSIVNLNSGTLAMFGTRAAAPAAGSYFNFNGGTLKAVANNTTDFINLTGNMALVVKSGGAVIDTAGYSVTIANALTHDSGLGGTVDGGLTKTGSGTLTLSGANTYTGSTTINASAGMLTIGGAGNLAAAGTISIGSGATFNYNSSAGQTLSGTISGNGALIQNGTGSLTLSGASTYSGGTTLSAGQLNINFGGSSSANSAIGTGTLTISGGTLENTSSGDVVLLPDNSQNWNSDFTYTGSAHNLNLGAGVVTMSGSRIVTVSANTLTVGGTISGSTYSLTKAGAGTLTLSGNNGYTGGTTLSVGSLLIGNANALGTSGTITFNGGTLASSSTTGYTLGSAGSLSFTGDATFGQTSGGTGTLTLSGNGTLTAIGHTLTVNNNTTLSGAIGGTGSLTKGGSGLLTFGGNNTYTGSTTINAGTLTLSGGGITGAGTVTVANTAVMNIQNGSTLTMGTKPFYVGQTANGAIVNQTGGIVSFTGGNQLLIGNRVGAVDPGFNGTYNMTGGTLTSTGTGALGLVLGVNSGTISTPVVTTFNLSGGAINMSSTLQVGRNDSAGVNYTTDTYSQTGGTANFGTLTIGGGGNGGTINANFIVTGGNFTATNFGTLGGTTANTASMTIGGTATVSLPAFPNNAGTRYLTFDGGTLVASVASTSYMPNLFTTATITSQGANIVVNAGSDTIAQVFTGAGALNKYGADTLTLSGANTYTGGTTINASAGMLTIGGAGNLAAAGTISIGSGATFNYNSSAGQTVSGTISGNGALIQNGTGSLTLSGANTYTGTTLINAGILQIGAGGTSGSLSPSSTITDNATLSFNRSDTITQGADFNNVIGGSGNVVQAGVGTLILNGANTYTGQTIINAGTLSVTGNLAVAGGAGNLGSVTASTGTLTLGGGTLRYAGTSQSTTLDRPWQLTAGTGSGIDVTGNSLTISTAAPGTTGALITSGAGTLTLTGANLYTGGTTITGGTLVMGNSTALGTISTGGAGSVTFGSSTAVLVVGSTGTIGALSSASGGTITSTGSYTLTSSGTGTQSTTFSGVMQDGVGGSSTLSFTKTGTGSLTLSGANTYSGATTVNAGVLALAGSGSIGSSPTITVANGATLNVAGLGAFTLGSNQLLTSSGSGTFSVVGNMNVGGILSPGGSAVGVIAFNSGSTVSFNNGGRYLWTISDAGGVAGTGYDTLSNIGTLDLNSGSFTINISNNGTDPTGWNPRHAGTWTLASAGTISGNPASITVNTANFNSSMGDGTFSLSSNAGNLLLNFGTGTGTGSVNAYWTIAGGGTGTWDTGTTTAWTYNAAGSGGSYTWTANDSAIFSADNIGTGSYSVTVGSGGVSANNLTIKQGNPTFTGGTITVNNGMTITGSGVSPTINSVISGNASLTMAGTGTLILSVAGNNTLTGDIVISGGTLSIGNNTATTLNGGTFSGNIINNGALQLWSSSAQTLSGVISGSGTLYKAYGGALTLSGQNTYSGKTTLTPRTTAGFTVNVSSFNSVNGGTPLLASSSLGCPTTPANGTIDIGVFSAQASVTLNYTGPGETTDRSLNIVFNGNLSPGGHTINASGGGLLKFTSAFTVTPSAGTGYLILGGTGSGEIVQGLTAMQSDGLKKQDSGIWILDGNNTYTTPTTISGGTLQIGNGGTTGSLSPSSAIANTATLVFNRSNTMTQGQGNDFGTISGSNGQVIQNGTGTVILTLANTYTGATTINAGILSVGSLTVGAASNIGSTTAAAGNLVINGGALQYTGATVSCGRAFTLGANGGTLDASGTGTLTLGNSGSVVALSGAGASRTLTLAGSNTGNNTLNLVIQDNTGSITALTKSGTGTWVLTGANTYSGGTTLSGGILQISAPGNLGTTTGGGTVTFNGGTLQTTASITLLNNGTLVGATTSCVNPLGNTLSLTGNIGGSGTLAMVGAGTLTLSGANTYSGGTVINGGILNAGTTENAGTSGPFGKATAAGTILFGGGALQYSAANHYDYSGRFSTSGSQPISIDVNGQTVAFATAIQGAGTSLTLADSIGGGKLTLSAANSYTGKTTINSGTVSVSAINDYGTVGGLGQNTSANVTQLGGGANAGTLIYTGGGESNNRTFQIGDSTAANAGGGVINNTGAGALIFNASTFNPAITGITATRTLKLGGTYAGVSPNEIQGTIQDNNGSTGKLGLIINGSSWKLSGSATSISGLAATSALGIRVQAGTLTISGGTTTVNTYGLGSYTTDTGTFNQTGGSVSLAGNLIVGWNSGPTFTLSGGSLTAANIIHTDASAGTLTIGGTAIVTASNVYNSTAGSGTDSLTLNLNTGGTLVASRLYVNATGSGGSHALNVNFSGGTLKASATGNLIDVPAGVNAAAATVNVTNKVGGAVIDSGTYTATILQPIVHDSTLGATPDGGLTKQGNGTLVLSAAANTYTGDTTISAGTLTLSNAGTLASTPNIILASGAGFDVSTPNTALTLGSGQTLKVSATGGNTTATITVGSGKNLTLGGTTTGLAFTAYGGGATAPLTVTGAAGSLDLNGKPVTVTTTTALAAGNYKLIAASGLATVTGTPGTLTVNGAGVASGSPALQMVSNELWLYVPAIGASGSLTALSTTYGTASSLSSVGVSGSGLTADVTATAQTGFEVSSDGATFGHTATFTRSGGTASGTLYVRLAATAAAGSSYNSVTAAVLSSTGVAAVNVTTTGSGNTVGQRVLTFTGSKTYDGTASATAAQLAFGNNLDGGNLTMSGSVTLDAADAGPRTITSFAGLSLGGSVADNYTLSGASGAVTVDKKALSITTPVVTKPYDGNTSPGTVTVGTLSGFVGSETVTATGVATDYSAPDIGSSYTVTVSYTLHDGDHGGKAANYSLADSMIHNADIAGSIGSVYKIR